jgi:hypothetical protein
MAQGLTLPFVLIHDDGSVQVVHELPLEHLKGRVNMAFTIFTREGQARPRRVIETRSTSKRIFGKERLAVTFEWTAFERYEIAVLAMKLRNAIEVDDDVYAQSRSHAEHLDAIDKATSFDDLVLAIHPP